MPHHRALLLQSAKAAMEAPYPGAAEQQCCRSTAEMLPPPQRQRVDFGRCCQGSGAGLAQLPSAGLLQIFTAVFKSKTRFIKQLGLRERTFFSSVSGAGALQGPGNAYSTTLHCCPKDPLLWRRKGKEFQNWQVFSANPLSSARALLYLTLIFMLISFYNFYG